MRDVNNKLEDDEERNEGLASLGDLNHIEDDDSDEIEDEYEEDESGDDEDIGPSDEAVRRAWGM
jgi:hypothetical protein